MNILTTIASYHEIVIQCHDNPDPDAIASGYALYEYLRSIGKTDVRLIYSGYNQISKSNITSFVSALQIPLSYVTALPKPELLVTVDCQYGAGNVKRFDASMAASIDHHRVEISDIPISHINPNLSGCSTLLWQLLREVHFDFEAHETVATALYYGLFCDSNNFAELKHPLDKDLRDELLYDEALIRKLRNSNLSLPELQIAAIALATNHSNDTYHYTIFKADPCDPNILGFISDIALQVDSIDVCVVYSETSGGIKLSIRSSVREVQADELAAYLTARIGNGGGHLEKAGGFISLAKLRESYSDTIQEYLEQRLLRYYENCDIIYSQNHTLSIADMKSYQKKHFHLQYVKTTDIWPVGTTVTIRTLECDIDVISSDDIYLMIGVKGEVYPISREKFNKSYVLCENHEDHALEYFPTARDKVVGKSIALEAYAHPCISTGNTKIWTQQLYKRTKVFTAWDKNRYMYGKKGDYIAIRADDMQDVYIIDGAIFDLTYKPAELINHF